MPNLLSSLPIEFSFPKPTIENSLLIGKLDGSLTWTSQNSLFYKPISNVIYVTKNGRDINTGKSLEYAKSSIKSALSAAKDGTTIIISSGLYKEQTPLICPPNVTITSQGSLVQIEAIDNSKDVFYLNSGVVVDGLTIINTRTPSFAFSLKNNIQVTKVPIIKNCSVISGPFLNDNSLFVPYQTIQLEGVEPSNVPIINNPLVPINRQINPIGAGNGILIDGNSFSLNSNDRAVMIDSCNLFLQGGIGILTKNSAKCYANNINTKFCSTAFKTETGGKLILNSCTNSYGNYALSADGFYNEITIEGIAESATTYPDTELIGQIKVINLIKQPVVGNLIEINDIKYHISGVTALDNGVSYISIMSNLSDITPNTSIVIYDDSKIIANNHCLNYVGSGITYNALPENNGQENTQNQIIETNFGSVHYTGIDSTGLFKIGDIFEINQITGAVTTTPTTESLINLGSIGPLIRNGVPVGTKMKEISDNIQLISSTGEIDTFTVPTQSAVYNYVNNNYLSLNGGIVDGSVTIQDILLFNNAILSTGINQNIVLTPSGTGSVDVTSSKIINLAAPVNDNDAATKKYVFDLIQGGMAPVSIIPILWGSNEDEGYLTLRSTQSNIKPSAGIILDDDIPSTSHDTGTLVIKGGVGITGTLNATTKSFDIIHPLDSKKRLRYGSLESPYHGIQLTGKAIIINGKCVVKLPDYICKLVKEIDTQIQLTNIKHNKILWVDSVDVLNNQFVIKSEETDNEYQFYWSFTAIRKDVDDLIVEYTPNEYSL